MPNRRRLILLSGSLLLILLVNTAYLTGFPSATLFYMANVMLHVGAGLALVIPALMLARRIPALGAFLFCAAAGIFLMVQGNITRHRMILWVHIALGLLSVLVLIPFVRRLNLRSQRTFAVVCALLVIVPASGYLYRRTFPDSDARIRNPLRVPTNMNEEGGGPSSPFFPSSSKTNVGGTIPSNFFMDSKGCGECHKEIYEQWNGSAHHFASFNNQFYRKSIEYMQDVKGTRPSKWCAGCHDHAVFFNGRFDRPIKEQIDTPEAQNGLGCMSCHSITHVDSSMGNAGFTMEYPPLHEIANSNNPLLHQAYHFLTYLNPEPHRRTFMKPFMRQDGAEFCSTCHKVHLDVPVNDYRWFRGFNDYDNWQASGVSGQGARSFYYPKQSATCGGCHMPMVKASSDPAAKDGMVHSHRFPGANTALPYVNRDKDQMDATVAFLKSGFITVDIFAVSPEKANGTAMIRRNGDNAPQAMSGFAVGEEAEQSSGGFIREVGELAAPINHSGAKLEPGSTARVDVVVRTRKIGHFFPGGTVDSFDVWLELKAEDASGKTVFWSGSVADGGKGPVDSGAHFYRAFQLDAEGNQINKRNAYQARSVLYVRLIPPGAADTVHYRIKVPKDAKGAIKFTAKLNYRKFSHYYTQFAYAGQPKPGQDPKLIQSSFNSAEYSFDPHNIPANVSGQIKNEIPNLPIVTVATNTVEIPIGAASWKPAVQKADRERWNDWGIGLLLQGDLKGAEYAFHRVTEAEPGYADGWVNLARTLIQEGETDVAKTYLGEALKRDASLGRIYYFRSLTAKSDGDYDAALADLKIVLDKYPKDRVVLNQYARVQFLKRDYRAALETLQRVGGVDPEDLQFHYTSMLCYRGLGDRENAAREEVLFRRFKAEESSQSITQKVRMASPEDNNERQQIHEHDSSL